MKSLFKLLSVLLIIVGVVGCAQVECPLNNTVYGHYAFYSWDGKTEKAVSLSGTLTVTATGTDSVLLNLAENVSQMVLPVSYFKDRDSLVLTVKQYVKDTVTIADWQTGLPKDTVLTLTVLHQDTVWYDKTNYSHYDNPDCPMSMFHEITSTGHTAHFIDSLSVVKTTMNYDEDQNIKFIFRR